MKQPTHQQVTEQRCILGFAHSIEKTYYENASSPNLWYIMKANLEKSIVTSVPSLLKIAIRPQYCINVKFSN